MLQTRVTDWSEYSWLSQCQEEARLHLQLRLLGAVRLRVEDLVTVSNRSSRFQVGLFGRLELGTWNLKLDPEQVAEHRGHAVIHHVGELDELLRDSVGRVGIGNSRPLAISLSCVTDFE